MSQEMLLAALRAPVHGVNDSIAVTQLVGRAHDAADEIERLERKIRNLEGNLELSLDNETRLAGELKAVRGERDQVLSALFRILIGHHETEGGK